MKIPLHFISVLALLASSATSAQTPPVAPIAYSELFYDVRIFKIDGPMQFESTGGTTTITSSDESPLRRTDKITELTAGDTRLVLDGREYQWQGQPVDENPSIHYMRSHKLSADMVATSVNFRDSSQIQYFIPKVAGNYDAYRLVSFSGSGGMKVSMNATSMSKKPTTFLGNTDLMEAYNADKNRKVPMTVDVQIEIRNVKERSILKGTNLRVGKPAWVTNKSTHTIDTTLGHWAAFMTSASNQRYLVLFRADYPYSEILIDPAESNVSQFTVQTKFLELKGKRDLSDEFIPYKGATGFENVLIFDVDDTRSNPNKYPLSTDSIRSRSLFPNQSMRTNRLFGFESVGDPQLISAPRVTNVLYNNESVDKQWGRTQATFKLVLTHNTYAQTDSGTPKLVNRESLLQQGINILAPEDQQVDVDWPDRFLPGLSIIADITSNNPITYQTTNRILFPKKEFFFTELGVLNVVKGYETDDPNTIELDISMQFKRRNPDAPKRLVGLQAAKDSLEYIHFMGRVKVPAWKEIGFLKTLSDERHLLVLLTAGKIDPL
jgi:hypothetical protein